MFAQLQPVATDPILGLMAAYKDDPNPNKVDLGVGVYKDEQGHTAVLKCVKEAEALRLKNEDSKTYIGMAGDLGFNSHIEKLALVRAIKCCWLTVLRLHIHPVVPVRCA